MAKMITKVGSEENEKVIIPIGKFDEISPVIFDNGEESTNLFKVIASGVNGLVLVHASYTEGYAEYNDIYRLGTINKKCIVVSDYDEVHGEKWAMLSTECLELVTNYIYDVISPINEDLYMTKLDGLFGVIDRNGNEILPNNFTEISYESAYNTFTVKLYSSDE